MTTTYAPRAGAEPLPYIMTNPYISLDGHEIHCLGSHFEIAPDVSTTETPTFCGTLEFPGTVKWYLRLTLYQSFDAGGTDELLCAMLTKGTVEFEFRPYKDKPEGPTNPTYTGEAIPRAYTLVSGDAGEASTIDIEWTLTGEPTRTPPCPATTGTASPAGPLSTTAA